MSDTTTPTTLKFKDSCPLWKFVRENQLFVYTDDKKRKASQMQSPSEPFYTHLSMYNVESKNGKMNIPNDKMEGFLEAYTNSIQRNDILSISEQRTPIFKFFMDVDIKYYRKLKKDELVCLVGIIQKSLKLFFPKIPQDPKTIGKIFACVVSISGGKDSLFTNYEGDNHTDENEPEDDPFDQSELCAYEANQILHPFAAQKDDPMVKVGIHLNFPWLNVTSVNALLIRETILAELNKFYGDFFGFSKWNKIIDEAIYLSNGLRMIYSYKAPKCKQCHGLRKSKPCPHCTHGHCIGPAYQPIFVMNGNGSFMEDVMNKMDENMHFAVKLTSIRCCANESMTPDFEIYPNAPKYIPQKDRYTLCDHTVVHKDDGVIIEKIVKNREKMTDGNLIKKVNDFINHMNDQYKNIQIQDIYLDDSKSNVLKYTVRVKGEGAWYCQNKNSEHTSNNIYFEIDMNGIYQRCWSRNDGCRTYKSQKITLTTELFDELFKKKCTQAHIHNDLFSASSTDDAKQLKELGSFDMLFEANKNQIERKQNRRKNSSKEEDDVLKFINQTDVPQEWTEQPKKKRKTQ